VNGAGLGDGLDDLDNRKAVLREKLRRGGLIISSSFSTSTSIEGVEGKAYVHSILALEGPSRSSRLWRRGRTRLVSSFLHCPLVNL
jgi:hypothetical protein